MASGRELVLSLNGQKVLADCCAQRIRLFPMYHAYDTSSAGSPQDHVPICIHVLLYRGDHVGRHGYVAPQLLLIRDVRREHLDAGDGGTEASSGKQWDVCGAHTLSFLLYRWPVKGQAVGITSREWRPNGPHCVRYVERRRVDLGRDLIGRYGLRKGE